MGSGIGDGDRMNTRMRILVLFTSLGMMGLAVVTAAQNGKSQSPSSALVHRAEGLILARCSVCHSPDLIYQQRLGKDRWEATVEKMMRWGAEISNEEANLLVQYLAARYHPQAPDQLPPFESELGKMEPLSQETMEASTYTGVARRGASLYSHNCQACHGAEGVGGVGPKLAKNQILTREDLFWETVLHGRGQMPAWGSVLNQQEIADIHAWLLSR